MSEPLTPAQVELIEEVIADRHEALQTEVARQIAEAVSPLQVQVDALTQQVATLQEALAVLDAAALKLGVPLALRCASGLLLCADEGGPSVAGDPVFLVGRETVGGWESFIPERGQ